VSNDQSGTVSVIDTNLNRVIGSIAVWAGPNTMTMDVTGARLYVPNYTDGTISVIDTASGAVVATIGVGANPFRPAVNLTRTRTHRPGSVFSRR